jgi:hypothetical protein
MASFSEKWEAPWLYFSEAPYCPTSPDETDEWGKVLKRKAFYSERGLYSAYTPETFTDRIRSHLLSYVFANYPPAAIPQITAMSLPAVVRAESRTDIIGDVLLHFSGYPPGTYDLRLMINTAITNPVDSDFLTDVYLTMEGGTRLARGRLGALSVLAFLAVPIDSTQFDMRISGVRASISTLSVGPEYPKILGAVSIEPTDGTASPTTIEPNLTLGFIKRSFAFRVWAADESRLPLCLYTMEGVNAQLATNPAAHDAKINLYVQFTELLPGFVKTMAEEGPSASWGTRLKVEIAPIPPGVQIFVTTRDIPVSRDAPARAVLAPLEDGRSVQLGVVPEGTGGTVDGVPIVGVRRGEPWGRAVAVWEWVKERPSPATLEDVVFGVIVVAEPDYPAFAPVSVCGSLAPVSLALIGPIPRFVNNASQIPALSLQPRGMEEPWR